MNEYLPGLEGVPATKSNISDLDGKKGILTYRGYRIRDLAERSSFEEVSLLLLDGRLPTREALAEFDRQIRSNRPVKYNIREIMKYLPATGHPMEMLQELRAVCRGDHEVGPGEQAGPVSQDGHCLRRRSRELHADEGVRLQCRRLPHRLNALIVDVPGPEREYKAEVIRP